MQRDITKMKQEFEMRITELEGKVKEYENNHMLAKAGIAERNQARQKERRMQEELEHYKSEYLRLKALVEKDKAVDFSAVNLDSYRF